MSNEEIVKKIRDGGFSHKDLYEQLYLQNKTLLIKICKKYDGYADVDDLMQECYFGIVQAVDHYEDDRQVKFMSYAPYWIENQLRQYIRNCCMVYRLPQYYSEKISLYEKYIKQFESQYDRKPTDKEIMQALDIRHDTLVIMRQYLKGVVSINTPLNTDGENLTIEDSLLADVDIENNICDEMYYLYEKKQLWRIAGDHTDEKQLRILKLLFINNYTMKKISELEGISVSMVHAIKRNALIKLRSSRVQKRLNQELETNLYRGGLNSYKHHINTSIVERIAIKDIDGSY